MANTKRDRENRYALRYIYPTFTVLLIVLILPLCFSIVASFMKWNLVPRNIRWIGLKNYTDIFSDPKIWHAAQLTISFTVLAVAIEMLLGFLIASFLNIDFKGNRFVRVIVLLPMMLSPTVIAMCFKLILNYDRGLLNKFVSFLFGSAARQVWLGKDWAFLAVLLVEVWINTSFVVLNVLAGLQSVNQDIIEASKIDGAGTLQRTWHIILPSIRSVLLVALIFRTTFALRNFAVPYVLTGGGPADYTQFYSLELYKEAFGKYHIGFASALSWLLIVLTMVLSVFYTKLTLRGEDSND